MSSLRQTVGTDSQSAIKSPLENNYRPVQSVNRRAVRTNINFPLQVARKNLLESLSLSGPLNIRVFFM